MKYYKPALYKVHMMDDLLVCFRIDEKRVKISLSEKGYFSWSILAKMEPPKKKGNGKREKRAVKN